MTTNESPKIGFVHGCLAPTFDAICFHLREVFHVSPESFPGKMVLLIFYPIDFDYNVCMENMKQLMAQGLEVMMLEAKEKTVLCSPYLVAIFRPRFIS